MKKIIALLFLLVLILNSCGENGVEPIPQPQPGRRDYVWTVDTLNPGGFYPNFNRIWGSSPADVYVTGQGNPPNNNLWHYDGISWKPSTENYLINLFGFYGFAKNDIWLSSVDNGEIWHYNGTAWILTTKLQLDGYKVAIENFWGTSSNNLYASTIVEKKDYTRSYGAVFHYDGNSWKRTTTVDYEDYLFDNIRINNTDSILVINAWAVHSDLEKILIWTGKNFSEILSTFEGTSLINIGDKIFFSNGKRVYQHGKENFTLWQDFTGTEFQRLLGARNERDVFTISKSGIGHFNGTDFQTIYKTNFAISRAAIFEKEVFFITHDGFNTKPVVVIRGKLKE